MSSRSVKVVIYLDLNSDGFKDEDEDEGETWGRGEELHAGRFNAGF